MFPVELLVIIAMGGDWTPRERDGKKKELVDQVRSRLYESTYVEDRTIAPLGIAWGSLLSKKTPPGGLCIFTV